MWKKLWQHFLTDQSILQQMQRSLADLKKEYWLQYCLEIGPWEWALTKRLKSVFDTKNIIAFEADLTLENKIAKFFPLEQVVWGDVLGQRIELIANGEQLTANKKIYVNWTNTWFKAQQTLICWNLPYYITSPILRKFFEQWQFGHGWFLIQKEVADKIASDAKKKSFLRWIMNYHYEVETIIAVPPEAFSPPPRVDSAVIVVRKQAIRRSFSLQQLTWFLELVNQYSRKTLWKCIKLLAKHNIVVDIPEALRWKRVEELKWDEMEQIVNSEQLVVNS